MPLKDLPTPHLKTTHAKRRIFTHAENALLDQITLEVTEAWKKDLVALRKHYKIVEAISVSTKDIVEILEDKLPKLEKFIQSNEFIRDFKMVQLHIQEFSRRQEELNKTIFELEKKLNYDNVKFLSESIQILQELVNSLYNNVTIPWWKKIFKR